MGNNFNRFGCYPAFKCDTLPHSFSLLSHILDFCYIFEAMNLPHIFAFDSRCLMFQQMK